MGASRFEWPASAPTQSFTSDIHVQEQSQDHDKERHVGVSLDRSVYEVVTVGNGAKDLLCDIVMDDDPVALDAMIEAGLDGIDLKFTPDIGAGTVITVSLIEAGRVEVEREGRQNLFGARRLRLRRLDGQDFAGILAFAPDVVPVPLATLTLTGYAPIVHALDVPAGSVVLTGLAPAVTTS